MLAPGHLAPLALAASIVAPGCGQAFTSPRGFGAVEGDSSHFVLFSPFYERFMQVDDTNRGHGLANLSSIAFRQDGHAANRNASGGTAVVTIRVGESDYGSVGPAFDSNWSGTPTVAFGTKQLVLPDWSQAPQSQPAPWNFVVPFDQPWSYSGNQALAWEVTSVQVTSGDGPQLDRQLGAPNTWTSSLGTSTDTGCIVDGGVLPMNLDLELRNYGPNHPQFGMRFGVGVRHAPANQPAVLNVALTSVNLSIPGLCARLHADPLIAIPLGRTTVFGDVPALDIDIPHVPAAEGVAVVTQAAALWPNSPSLPVALSNDQAATMPLAPRPSPTTTYIYSRFALDTAGNLFANRGVVARFAR